MFAPRIVGRILENIADVLDPPSEGLPRIGIDSNFDFLSDTALTRQIDACADAFDTLTRQAEAGRLLRALPETEACLAAAGEVGPVTLAPTLRIEIDIPVTGDIPNDRVEFSSVGPVLDGILDVNLVRLPDPGAEFRVISTSGATGSFADIRGVEAFDQVVENADGVVLIR